MTGEYDCHVLKGNENSGRTVAVTRATTERVEELWKTSPVTACRHSGLVLLALRRRDNAKTYRTSD